MRKLLLITILGLGSCINSNNKPLCNPEPIPIGNFGNLEIPYSGYFDINKALECSKNTNKPVLVIYGGFNVVSDFKTIWGVLLEKEIQEIIKNEFILTYLFVDDQTPLEEIDPEQKLLNGKIVKTVGQKNLKQQIDKYQNNAQPLYVLLDKYGNDLTTPIGYTPIKDKQKFIDFLSKGKNNWH